MKRLLALSVLLGLTIAFSGAIVTAAPINSSQVDIRIESPLYAEIRGLAESVDLPPLSFGDPVHGNTYRNKSTNVPFNISTNGDIDLSLEITEGFQLPEHPEYWLRTLVYVRRPDNTSVFKTVGGYDQRVEWNRPGERPSLSGLLKGPGNYLGMYLNIEASRLVDIHELMAGEYTGVLTLTVAAPH